jgi:Protein of unknown function (DUF3108)
MVVRFSSTSHLHIPHHRWSRKALSMVIAFVLLMHFSVLGDVQQWIRWGVSRDTKPLQTIAMNTRVLAPHLPPQAPAVISPKPPTSPPAAPTELPNAQATTETTTLTTPEPPPAEAEPSTEPPPEITEAPSPALEQAAAQDTADTAQAPQLSFPASTTLSYEVMFHNGDRKIPASAELAWSQDGANYQASLRVTKFTLNLLQWTSHGALTDGGLAPLRFGDKRRNSSELATHFVRDQGKIIFSANTPEAPLLPGAQDTLSVVLQLASMWAAAPQQYAAGQQVTLQVAEARHADTWIFTLTNEDSVEIDGRKVPTIKLIREATARYDTTVELWLAPEISHLPARLRLSKTNGDVLDLVWTGKQPT